MNTLTNKIAKPPRIPAKRKRFADAYLKGGSLEKAYVSAGYAENTAHSNAHRLMADDSVRAYIEFYRIEIARRNRITEDEIVSGIRGVIIKSKKANENAIVLKGYELLAKMGGYLRDQGTNPEQRPAFVGISINMGKGIVEMKHTNPIIKESSAQSRGNSVGMPVDKTTDGTDIIDATADSK